MIKTIGKRRYKKQPENCAKCTSNWSQNAWSELMRSANMATLASSSGLFGSQAPSQALKAVILGSYTAHLDLSFSIPQMSCIAANVYLAYKVHLTVRITILLSTTRIANISALCLLQCPSFAGHQQRLPCTILQGRARVAHRSLHDIFGPLEQLQENVPTPKPPGSLLCPNKKKTSKPSATLATPCIHRHAKIHQSVYLRWNV